MSIINSYGLELRVSKSEISGRFLPEVFCPPSEDGVMINAVIGNFFGHEGVKRITLLKEEIEEFIADGSFPIKFLGPHDEEAVITNDPLEIAFNPTAPNEIKIPLSDFSSMLDEWIFFLESLPFNHLYSNG